MIFQNYITSFSFHEAPEALPECYGYSDYYQD